MWVLLTDHRRTGGSQGVFKIEWEAERFLLSSAGSLEQQDSKTASRSAPHPLRWARHTAPCLMVCGALKIMLRLETRAISRPINRPDGSHQPSITAMWDSDAWGLYVEKNWDLFLAVSVLAVFLPLSTARRECEIYINIYASRDP